MNKLVGDLGSIWRGSLIVSIFKKIKKTTAITIFLR